MRPSEPDRVLASLSGGNQQKALLAKWIQLRPKVLVMHEPTQGVDIGAKSQIFGLLREVAREGTAILVCSSEYEDLAHLCDRVLLLRDGRVERELAGDALTEDAILSGLYLSSDERLAGTQDQSPQRGGV